MLCESDVVPGRPIAGSCFDHSCQRWKLFGTDREDDDPDTTWNERHLWSIGRITHLFTARPKYSLRRWFREDRSLL